MGFTVRGTIMQTPGPTKLEVRHGVAVAVNDDGIITSIEHANDVAPLQTVLLPGLIDTHIHAPQ